VGKFTVFVILSILQVIYFMQFQVEIYVTLRPAVLDPAGTAVQSSLRGMNYDVEDLRIGKYIQLTLIAEHEAQARAQVEEMCTQVLTNPVIETYRFELNTPKP
jgi:phosphoribosylformylglycinamidine synthase